MVNTTLNQFIVKDQEYAIFAFQPLTFLYGLANFFMPCMSMNYHYRVTALTFVSVALHSMHPIKTR